MEARKNIVLFESVLAGKANTSSAHSINNAEEVNAIWGIVTTTYSGPAPDEPVKVTITFNDGSHLSGTVNYQSFMENPDLAHLIIIRKLEQE